MAKKDPIKLFKYSPILVAGFAQLLSIIIKSYLIKSAGYNE